MDLTTEELETIKNITGFMPKRINVFLTEDMDSKNPKHREMVLKEIIKSIKDMENGYYEEITDFID